MSWNLEKILRPNVVAMAGYESARSLAVQGDLYLDANESPFDEPAKSGFNRYPEPQPESLRRRLSAMYGCRPEMTLLSRGADEGIDLLFRATCRPGIDAVLQFGPTYGMYRVGAALQGVDVIDIPLLEGGGTFSYPQDVTEQLVQARAKLVFLCRPNNPSGECSQLETVAQIAGAALKSDALVVVDEAYIEFSPQASAVELLGDFPNIVVLRTLSKAWGLAGMRVGCLIGDPQLVHSLQKIRAPYPLATPVVEAVEARLSEQTRADVQARVDLLVSERQRLAARLNQLPSVRQVFHSEANFLLVRFTDSATVFADLAAAGIIVRDRSSDRGLDQCLRISIGRPEDNDRLLANLGNSRRKSVDELVRQVSEVEP